MSEKKLRTKWLGTGEDEAFTITFGRIEEVDGLLDVAKIILYDAREAKRRPENYVYLIFDKLEMLLKYHDRVYNYADKSFNPRNISTSLVIHKKN
jgi:hypothetical protein